MYGSSVCQTGLNMKFRDLFYSESALFHEIVGNSCGGFPKMSEIPEINLEKPFSVTHINKVNLNEPRHEKMGLRGYAPCEDKGSPTPLPKEPSF